MSPTGKCCDANMNFTLDDCTTKRVYAFVLSDSPTLDKQTGRSSKGSLSTTTKKYKPTFTLRIDTTLSGTKILHERVWHLAFPDRDLVQFDSAAGQLE